MRVGVLRDVIRLQQLGIFSLNVDHRKLVGGKLCYLSTAVTVTHFMTTSELNLTCKKARSSHERGSVVWQDYAIVWRRRRTHGHLDVRVSMATHPPSPFVDVDDVPVIYPDHLPSATMARW